VDFGTSSPTPWASYDPATSSWKTSQPSLPGVPDSTSSCPTLPPSGSLRNGHVYARPTSAPRTGGNGGSWLLKTPTAQLAVNGGSQHPAKRKAGGHGPTLADEVEHLLPTPRATDGTKGGPNQRGSHGDLMLPSAVVTLLPSPAARDGKGTDLPSRTGGPSLPTLLSGAGTHPPSPGGNTSPAGQLLIPLNPDETDDGD
jgi:hypothetical protein